MNSLLKNRAAIKFIHIRDGQMVREPEITFRHIDPTPELRERILTESARLDQFSDQITSLKVMVEKPHVHHRKGNLVHLRIDIHMPGKELVVSRDHHDKHQHKDVYVAIRDAFDAAQRQIEDYVRQKRGDVKFHVPPSEGRIFKLFPNMDYGLIQDRDGREIYFHRNSIVNAEFDKLQEGAHVRFAEEQGSEGPQASTVHLN